MAKSSHLLILQDSLQGILPCDCLITDPPYSSKTHRGAVIGEERKDGSVLVGLDYSSWAEQQIAQACRVWSPQTKGWMVIMCDDELAPIWKAQLGLQDRYVFPLIPAVIKGAGVRLRGDGPSSWTRFLVVARPRNAEFARWGTLPGAYGRAYWGPSERMPWSGGKPEWLMREVLADYSHEGDVVCDPCCGGGTTALAALQLGRSSVCYDIDPEAVSVTAERLQRERAWLEGRSRGD